MKTRIVSFMMAFVMIISVFLAGGCSKQEMTSGADAYETVGTINGEAIDYQLLFFAAKYEQANYEANYMESFGDEMWSETINGNITLEEKVKESILKQFKEMLVLEQYAADYNVRLSTREEAEIKNAATKFMEDNSEEAIKLMGASEEVVARYLTLYTIANKMYDRIVADVDTNFTKEEYQQATFTYVKFDKDDYKKSEVENLLKKAQSDYQGTLGAETEYTLTSCSFGVNGTSDTNITQDVLDAVATLEDKEIYSEVFVADEAYFILRMEDKFDEDASNTMYQTMVNNALEKKYNEVLAKYMEETTIEIDGEAWESIHFTNHFEIVTE